MTIKETQDFIKAISTVSGSLDREDCNAFWNSHTDWLYLNMDICSFLNTQSGNRISKHNTTIAFARRQWAPIRIDQRRMLWIPQKSLADVLVEIQQYQAKIIAEKLAAQKSNQKSL